MNRSPKIAITGSTGFVGKELVRHFADKGWQVVTLSRQPDTSSSSSNISNVIYNLEDAPNPDDLKGVDYIVHAAYVKNNLDLNIEAADRLLDASKKAGVKQILFISSMSAHDNASSIYGRQKRIIEKKFMEANRICLRPGLIAGNGGIFASILNAAKRYHVIPVISGGNQPVQLINLGDLVIAIEKLVSSNDSRIVTVAHPSAISYKSLYKSLCKKLQIKVLFLPLPYWLAYITFGIIGFVKPEIGIGKDNLAGLKKLETADTRASMKDLGFVLPPIEEYITSIDIG